ncbi:hypothetical protein HYV88_05475 [Candidatus Woesearchaeota archaeon]|nr:hypothetical protein [Candidatus Woesearchaeota archaeon]
MLCGYKLKEGERVYLSWKPPEECSIVGDYIIRVMERFEVRDSEGRLVRDLLKSVATIES